MFTYDTKSLKEQRQKIQDEIAKLEQAMFKIDQALEVLEGGDPFAEMMGEPATLTEAVGVVCKPMIDGITRGRVVEKVRKFSTYKDTSESSIASALAAYAQEHLTLVTKGEGRKASVYTSDPGTIPCHLTPDEYERLHSPNLVQGVGGWQSLVKKIRSTTDNETRVFSADAEIRARLAIYLANYGVGGWQSKLKAILGRALPHLFQN